MVTEVVICFTSSFIPPVGIEGGGEPPGPPVGNTELIALLSGRRAYPGHRIRFLKKYFALLFTACSR
jgi:hypothetical protein